jgi:hypothetical protein
MREPNQPIVEPSIISFNFDELTKLFNLNEIIILKII